MFREGYFIKKTIESFKDWEVGDIVYVKTISIDCLFKIDSKSENEIVLNGDCGIYICDSVNLIGKRIFNISIGPRIVYPAGKPIIEYSEKNNDKTVKDEIAEREAIIQKQMAWWDNPPC